MIKRFIIPTLLSVLITAFCAAQTAPVPKSSGMNPYAANPYTPVPGYNPYAANPYAPAPGVNPYDASSGYNPYAPASTGYNPYAPAPASTGYVPYASMPATGYNPYAPPTLTSEITPMTPPWEAGGAIPWPVPFPSQAAREWLPELAAPWIPGTGKPLNPVPAPAPVQVSAPPVERAPAASPVYVIVATQPAARYEPPVTKYEPPAARYEPPVSAIKVLPRMPGARDTTLYFVQVGAYQTRENALATFERLSYAGFSPAYETERGIIRVLIPWVRGSEMQETAERLCRAGFTEVLLRAKK